MITRAALNDEKKRYADIYQEGNPKRLTTIDIHIYLMDYLMVNEISEEFVRIYEILMARLDPFSNTAIEATKEILNL